MKNKVGFSFADHEDEYLENVTMGMEVEGSTELFQVKVMAVMSEAGNVVPMYGIFNRDTGVREAEQRTLHAAKTWAGVMTSVLTDTLDTHLQEDITLEDFTFDTAKVPH